MSNEGYHEPINMANNTPFRHATLYIADQIAKPLGK